MSHDTIPSLSQIVSGSPDRNAPLATALSLLFEPSDVLYAHLVPKVREHPALTSITSYSALLAITADVISQWDEDLKTNFIAGHPRIGEAKNLSKLSAQEQAARATAPEVLARLRHLNACYERRFPGLIYITFVNGRTRAAVMEEMEDALGFERSLSPDQPPLSSVAVIPREDKRWRDELERAVKDVGKIAESRVQAMGLV
jgi:2-oxo-4-hydroxy-4-carboxy--5-ureidoimidazoline (OHCU) decarboxylase